jgi:hypothetical protein
MIGPQRALQIIPMAAVKETGYHPAPAIVDRPAPAIAEIGRVGTLGWRGANCGAAANVI